MDILRVILEFWIKYTHNDRYSSLLSIFKRSEYSIYCLKYPSTQVQIKKRPYLSLSYACAHSLTLKVGKYFILFYIKYLFTPLLFCYLSPFAYT